MSPGVRRMGFNILKACFGASPTVGPVSAPPARRESCSVGATSSTDNGASTLTVLTQDHHVRALQANLAANARLLRADAFLASGKFNDARKIFEQMAVQTPPGSPQHGHAVDGLVLLSMKLRSVSSDPSRGEKTRALARGMSEKIASRAAALRRNHSA